MERSVMEEDEIRIGSSAALMQAMKSLKEGGIPIGSAMTIDGAVVSVGHNRRVQDRSNIVHGEMDCIERAGHTMDFSRATLFTTLSPCQMCTGAVLLFRIPRLVILDNENIDDFSPGTDLLRASGVEVFVRPHTEMIRVMRAFQKNDNTRPVWLGDVGQ